MADRRTELLDVVTTAIATTIDEDTDSITAVVDALLAAESVRVAELEAKVARVEAALANHPRCEKHPDDDAITCGWKSAVIDVQAALAKPSGGES